MSGKSMTPLKVYILSNFDIEKTNMGANSWKQGTEFSRVVLIECDRKADNAGFLSHSTGLSLDNSLPSFQEYASRYPFCCN